MNITKTNSNLFPDINFTNKTSTNKSNTYSSYNLEDSAEINKEEDEILYQRLKADGCDFTNHSLEDYKKSITAFPPLTAPGNVRRAYRLALENATPQEKKAANGMVFYMYIYKKQTENDVNNTNNSVNGYLNLMNNFKGYFTRYKYVLGGNEYKLFNGFLDNFTNELSKYKCD